MWLALVYLQRDQDIDRACRELNNRIDELLAMQTVEYRKGVHNPPAEVKFDPYDRAWFQTTYDIRRHRQKDPVKYEVAKWEAQIRSILQTKGPVFLKGDDDRTTDSTVPSEGAPSDGQ